MMASTTNLLSRYGATTAQPEPGDGQLFVGVHQGPPWSGTACAQGAPRCGGRKRAGIDLAGGHRARVSSPGEDSAVAPPEIGGRVAP